MGTLGHFKRGATPPPLDHIWDLGNPDLEGMSSIWSILGTPENGPCIGTMRIFLSLVSDFASQKLAKPL